MVLYALLGDIVSKLEEMKNNSLSIWAIEITDFWDSWNYKEKCLEKKK